MKKFFLLIGLILLLSVGVFAQEGRVVVDITYTVNNIEYTKRLVTYYDEHASALDFAQAELQRIERNSMILGEEYTDIKSAGLVESEGMVEATLTYDRGKTYKIQQFYDPIAKARHNVMVRLEGIRSEDIINGVGVSTVGEIMEIEGGFEAMVTDDDGKEHVFRDFYDPAAKARHELMVRLEGIRSEDIINGVGVDVVGEIMEIEGGFEAMVTDDDGKEFVYREFFDPKAKSHHNVMVKLNSFKDSKINGVAVDTLGEIIENAGRYEAVVTDDDGKEYVIRDFFDPKEAAIYEMTVKIETLKREGTLNGDDIGDLVVSNMMFE